MATIQESANFKYFIEDVKSLINLYTGKEEIENIDYTNFYLIIGDIHQYIPDELFKDFVDNLLYLLLVKYNLIFNDDGELYNDVDNDEINCLSPEDLKEFIKIRGRKPTKEEIDMYNNGYKHILLNPLVKLIN